MTDDTGRTRHRDDGVDVSADVEQVEGKEDLVGTDTGVHADDDLEGELDPWSEKSEVSEKGAALDMLPRIRRATSLAASRQRRGLSWWWVVVALAPIAVAIAIRLLRQS